MSSLKVFKVFGISIELDLTFLVLLFLVLFNPPLFGFLILVFSIVLIHELFHSLVALYYKIPVPKITLTPIGGLASIEVPEDPKKEFLVSIAGPFSNILFFTVIFLAAPILGVPLKPLSWYFSGGGIDLLDPSSLLSGLMWLNFVLGVFNLLPGYPMDGGRVFRAILASRMDYIRATQIAVNLGKVIAVLIFLWGLISLIAGSINGFLTMIIGIFLFFAGGQELQILKIRHALSGLSLREVAVPTYKYASESMPIREFVQTVAVPEQRHYPVTDASGKVVGIFNVEDLKAVGLADEGRPMRDYARGNLDVIDAGAKITDVLSFLLSRDFVLIIDANRIIGYITPAHLLDVARYQSIRRRAGM
jgi:Zn-dependent protease